MRFKKGDKVEVLSQKEVPLGSWRCGEIIYGNGHNFTVRYDGDTGATDKALLERVSRKAIRPCPPTLDVSEYWVAGVVVEVFNNYSWKMAMISKMLGKKYFLIRLLGSSLEFKISKFDIRGRQSWQDDKWVMIGEGSGYREDGKYYKNLTLKYCQNSGFQIKNTKTRINFHAKDDCSPVKNKVNTQVSQIASSTTLKRSHYRFSEVDGTGAAEKFRAVDKDGKLHRVIAANQSLLPEHVDPVAFPREMLGEKYMHPSFNNGTEFFDVEAERRRSSGAAGCSLAVKLESDDAHSVTCSVGSCSISNNNSYKLARHVSAGPIEVYDGNFSDAESFCHLGYREGNCLVPTKEELAAEIHRLELHAYHCTMEALHASGPLSWEQEALVTNLRLSLHISNDEHLMELRGLVSADNSIPIR